MVIDRVSQMDINNFVDGVFVDKKAPNHHLRILKISDAAADKIKNATGLDVKGYDYRFSSDDLKHIIKEHENEKAPDQVSITQGDFKNLPDIMNDFDTVKMETEENGEVRTITELSVDVQSHQSEISNGGNRAKSRLEAD